MFKWILVVIKTLMSTYMIGFYVHKEFSLNIGCIETFQINIQTILYFVNLWSKELPTNISYPIDVNSIDGYVDASISPISVRYNIKRYKQTKHKKNKIKRIQGGNIHRLLKK